MKKIEKSIQFLQNHLYLFQCPVCRETFIEINGTQMICSNHHSFDVSKKGTVHFLSKQPHNEYNTDMLKHRREIASKRLWHKLLEEVYTSIEHPKGVHLDVGCGEGSHLHHLKDMGLEGIRIGFDISKDAIQLAASEYTDEFWCVADLAQSPFAGASYDTIINILSPSNYSEFERLLRQGGQIIKAVPNEQYLVELRERLGKNSVPYSNQEVVDKFYEHYPDAVQKSVQYSLALSPEMIEPLLEMTPLGWNAEEEFKEEFINRPISQITVGMDILIGQKY